MNRETYFKESAEFVVADLAHRATINHNMQKYYAKVEEGLKQFKNLELARQRAAHIKWQTLEHLDKYLLEFEKNFTANGGKVIWAENKTEALAEIKKIAEAISAKSAVKAKSMTSEEIHLNEFLESIGVQPVETDLGEFIVQLAGEKPYHIVTPAIHKSKKDVAKIFNEKLNTPYTEDANELARTARKFLREKYQRAEIGITGGNFLIADTGGIAITENEGNARLTVTFPKTVISIVGIEKMIPKMEYLDLFWTLLAVRGTGQNVTVYNTILTGPKKNGEIDGPENMFVILLDNGRTNLLAKPEQRQALSCIRCGACLNVCPVYKNIGGYTYDATYTGPIGSVITPHYEGMKEFKHLSFASSLCGNCTEVCPVHIDLHELLLVNRKESVEKKLNSLSEKFTFRIWKQTMLKRKRIDSVPSWIKNLVLEIFFDRWSYKRSLPKAEKKSFSKLWASRKTD